MKISRKSVWKASKIRFISFFAIDTVDSFTIQYYVMCNVKTSLVHPFSVRK